MTEEFAAYLTILSVLAILIVPVAFFFTVYAWYLARRYWPYKLPTVIAIVNTIAFPISMYIGVLAWLRIRREPIAVETAPISAAVFLVLDMIPLITTGYLIYLDRKRGLENRRKGD